MSNGLIEKLYEIASKHFIVDEIVVSDGYPAIYVRGSEDLKQRFMNFRRELRDRYGTLIPFLERVEGRLRITVLEQIPFKKERASLPIVLLFVTIGTVFASGYLMSNNPIFFEVYDNFDPIVSSLLFTASLMGIIGFHEVGHKAVLAYYRIKASGPYFIPGIPGVFPTFGAIIAEKEPPVNRDALFSIGIAGPLAGLLMSILVSVYAAYTAPIVSAVKLEELAGRYGEFRSFPVPLLYLLIQQFVKPVSADEFIIVSPIIWSSVVGFIITGLNLLPAWQLDGGHIARAVLGERLSKVLTVVTIVVLLLSGFPYFALLILFLWLASGGRMVRPLDDYTSVAWWKKVAFIICLAIAASCMPLPF